MGSLLLYGTLSKNTSEKRKGGHVLPKTCYCHFRCRRQMMSLSLTSSTKNNVSHSVTADMVIFANKSRVIQYTTTMCDVTIPPPKLIGCS